MSRMSTRVNNNTEVGRAYVSPYLYQKNDIFTRARGVFVNWMKSYFIDIQLVNRE